jgi:5-aminolevulinate synthase
MNAEKANVETTNYDEFFSDMISGLKAEGRYRHFRRIERKRGELPLATADDQAEVVNWCSNDYLAMGQTEEVVGAAEAAAMQHRTGMPGIPSRAQVELERELASLHGKQAAIVFNSCYTANEAAIAGIVRSHPGCTIISDSDNHASMIQGIRQSSAPKLLWRHNDLEHLDALLAALPEDAPKLVVFESVYSMDGSVAPIEAILDVCERHGAMTFLDEVHAVGLYGSEGAGVAQRDGVMDRVDAISGTLGKAYGVIGGYVALSDRLSDALNAQIASDVPYQSDNFLPPPVVEAALSSVRAVRGDMGREMRDTHQRHAKGLMQMLEEQGLPVQPSESHIVPVLVGNAVKCKQAADMLLRDHQVYVQPINYPTVPRGTERLRFTPGPLHTPEMQSRLASALQDVWEKVGIDTTVSVEG